MSSNFGGNNISSVFSVWENNPIKVNLSTCLYEAGIGENLDGDPAIYLLCSPVDQSGRPDDQGDPATEIEISKLFSDISASITVDIGAAENYHVLDAPKGIDINRFLKLVIDRVTRSGAKEGNCL